MRRSIVTLLALVPCALLALAFARGQDAPTIAWRTDLVAARAEARETGKPLFLVFRCEQ
jgi:hypothetical protein